MRATVFFHSNMPGLMDDMNSFLSMPYFEYELVHQDSKASAVTLLSSFSSTYSMTTSENTFPMVSSSSFFPQEVRGLEREYIPFSASFSFSFIGEETKSLSLEEREGMDSIKAIVPSSSRYDEMRGRMLLSSESRERILRPLITENFIPSSKSWKTSLGVET